MAFENVKIVDPYVEKGWTAELKLTLATTDEVDAVEAKLNVSFPIGYKIYCTGAAGPGFSRKPRSDGRPVNSSV